MTWQGEASFILVIQKHPKLVTYKAQAYHVKCLYQTGPKTVTLGFNVSMITTAGTIANTGPPPTCIMRILKSDGGNITSAVIGEQLKLIVEVQPLCECRLLPPFKNLHGFLTVSSRNASIASIAGIRFHSYV